MDNVITKDNNPKDPKTRWYKDAVIYQIYPRSYADSNGDGIGDIQGIISKLDYIKQLGVDAIWLSPVYKSPNFDNGYDISDYRDINPEFGTMKDFDQLAEECKKRGIKIIMDLVVNHTSHEHEWFKESKKGGKDNPYKDYYIWRKGRGKDGKKPPNNWNSRFSGPAWTYDKDRKEWYLHLFTEQQPDLNWENPKVRKEVIDICEYWFKKGVDGFRCDVLTYIAKDPTYSDGRFNIGLKGTEKFAMYGPWHDYIKELNEKSWSKHDSMIVAEGADGTFEGIKQATDERNKEIDTFFSFEHLTADAFGNVIPRKFSLRKLKKIFDKWQGLPDTNWNTLFLENHDLIRSTSRYIKDERFLKEGSKMLCVAMQFQKGTPYVYQGQEIGMTNCKFTTEEFRDTMAFQIFDTVKKFVPFLMPVAKKLMNLRGRDNARTPMQWDSSKNAGFSDENAKDPWIKVNPNKDTINVKDEEADKDSVLNFYKAVIQDRKGNDIIKKGSYTDLDPKSKKIYIYERRFKDKAYLVVCNFTNKDVSYNLKDYDFATSSLKFNNYADAPKELSNKINLKPYETQVYDIGFAKEEEKPKPQVKKKKVQNVVNNDEDENAPMF